MGRLAAERRAGDGELQAASWENPVTNLLKAASEAPGPFSPVPSDSLRVLLRPRILSGPELPVHTYWQDLPLVLATSEGVGALGPRSGGKHRTLTEEE